MAMNIHAELKRLGTLTTPQLRARYADVFGEATRCNNRPYLFKRICWRLQADAEDDPQCDRLVLGPREGLLHAGLEHLALVDDLFDVRDRTEGGAVLEVLPVRVVCDQPRLVFRHFAADEPLDRNAEGLQDLTLLGRINTLERVEVGWVNGEQPM